MRVLVVEDDEDVRSVAARALARDGHTVTTAGSLVESRAAVAAGVDLLVLDLSLPDGCGLTLCRELKAREAMLRILILTARSQIELRVKGLEAGADEYLLKPFSVADLRARVRALGRRGPGAQHRRHVFNDVTLDLGGRRALRGSQQVAVTGPEWALLETLANRCGEVTTRTELLDICGGLRASASNTLELLLTRLGKKLGPGLIQTLEEGYAMSGTTDPGVP
jgi:two-component system OmpR family response regulator